MKFVGALTCESKVEDKSFILAMELLSSGSGQVLEASMTVSLDLRNKCGIYNLAMEIILKKDFILMDSDCFALNTT